MFRRLLVANRGEIAVRVLQACAEMGIVGIAVYPPDDAGALHVRRAEVAVPLPAETPGRPPAYLDVAAILGAAGASGAEALHPGYGFLSENPDLAEACRAAGIAFVGPPPEAMRRLGNKRLARELARSLDVPVLPGYEGSSDGEADEAFLAAAAAVGFPLLVKAAAGGGGRGIRRVARAEDLLDALASARREAGATFGDPSVYLEREAPRARHVEVQAVADAQGHVVHLGERECSVQRRHQKVLEECPSPAVSPALRRRLGGYAVRLFRAAGYVNAGTAEFLVTEDGRPHFLEVNTRLQVEHPVTEAVTGVDLVREQLRIAAGESLSFRQEDVRWRGHAVQCRLYAEDPGAGFRPSAGPVLLFEPPLGAGIRNDVGVESGDEASPRYDPLLAKLIVWAPDRAAAVARVRAALRRYAVLGVATNLSLLQAIVEAPVFEQGKWDTGYLEAHLDEILSPGPGGAGEAADLAPLLAAGGWRLTAPLGQTEMDGERGEPFDPWRGSPWRIGGQGVPLRFAHAGGEVTMSAWRTGDGWEVQTPAGRRRLRFRRSGPAGLIVEEAGGGSGRIWMARVVEHEGALDVAVDGRVATFTTPATGDEVQPAATAGGTRAESLAAPVPGVVVQVKVAPGQAVDAGEPLVVLEAMKMEFAVNAPHRGTVRRVDCAPGERVAAGTVLVEIEG
jgi:3-methylcrotonyl-CoA carboxylase alpha subunit